MPKIISLPIVGYKVKKQEEVKEENLTDIHKATSKVLYAEVVAFV